MTSGETLNEQTQSTFTLDGVGKLPTLKFCVRADAAVEYRYCVERGNYPGFDGHWRLMTDEERREHVRMGGRIAGWLRSLG